MSRVFKGGTLVPDHYRFATCNEHDKTTTPQSSGGRSPYLWLIPTLQCGKKNTEISATRVGKEESSSAATTATTRLT